MTYSEVCLLGCGATTRELASMRNIVPVALFTGFSVLACIAVAQDYPLKPIRIVVPFPPGGGADRLARLASERLTKRLGQIVIVDNRPGGGGNTGADYVFRAPPDGYTLMFGTPGPVVINKMLYAKLTYDSDQFTHISQLTLSPNILVVHPALPADSVKRLIALAKANPGKLNYGSAGIGTTPHLTAELFKARAGINVVHVPYKGSTILMTDLISGRVETAFFLLGNVLTQIRANRLRALAVTSEKRSALLPATPAMSEILPGFTSIQWIAAVAPPGMPATIANRLQSTLKEILHQPDVSKQLLELGDEPVGGTPAELSRVVRQERELWGKVIRDTGATVED
jgi:tripartite-type tricarboxylate transporter receptor subunit TctC